MKINALPALLLSASAGIMTSGAGASSAPAVVQPQFQYAQVDNVNLFYREAGSKQAPTVLMLHGFAASSFMWREVIDALANDYHVIALDLPGFGFTEAPTKDQYDYTFANITDTVDEFLQQQGINRFALLVHDYGAPVGWRLALKHPEQVSAIVSQNGNAYEEGLAKGWDPIKKYWQNPSAENRNALSDFPTPESIRWQYEKGVDNKSLIAPDGYTLEGLKISQSGMAEIQLDLLLDYASNVQQYPDYQAYFKAYQPPLLAVWGKNDPFFLPAGAKAWRRDLPNADIRLYDTGHFALETHAAT
ncbi:alpha/beta fold hydrolase, partial [Idiomarina xiamenensis]